MISESERFLGLGCANGKLHRYGVSVLNAGHAWMYWDEHNVHDGLLILLD